MRKTILAIVGFVGLIACSSGGGILPEDAVEITENRANSFLSPTGDRYDMRTYVVSGDERFFITVSPAQRSLTFGQDQRRASSAAAAYIQSRGCTRNLSRLSSQDRYDSANEVWTIVISC